MAVRACSFPTLLVVATILGGASPLNAQAVDFDLLADTDLSGGDIRLPTTDPALREITLDRCRDRCAADTACRAFTYNVQARVCFLKGEGYAAKPFAGAMSGRRLQASRPGPSGGQRPHGSRQDQAGQFELLTETDLSGGDIRVPATDPTLREITFDRCRDRCAADPACRAFTYNAKARVCFLKGEGSTAKRFAGATSGRRQAAATSRARLPALSDFSLLPGTWLEGRGRRLAQTTDAAQCAAACRGDEECVAFTLDSDRFCHLKLPGFRRMASPGATSGLVDPVLARARAAHDPFWPATRQGATCEPHVAGELPGLAAGTGVHVTAAAAPAGQFFPVRWTRGEMRGRYPAYLMVAFDKPVRFEGKGFYVLLPHAAAAFGITQFSDRTRLVIPLYGLGVPNGGEFKVRPLLAGSLQMEWTVVGHDFCRELVAAGSTGRTRIRVEATGEPEIVVAAFASRQPQARIVSPAGDRIVDVHEGRYRLVDEASGAELTERAGRMPRFSPTGRYVAAYVGDGMEIIDAVDGKPLYKDFIGSKLAWDNNDSFAIVETGGWGALAVVMPSVAVGTVDFAAERKPVLYFLQGCRNCIASDYTGVRIDLENNMVVVSGEDGGDSAASLSADAGPSRGTRDSNDSDQSAGDVAAFVKRMSQLTKVPLPRTWELRGGLKFSHIGVEDADSASAGRRDPLRAFLVKPDLRHGPALPDAVGPLAVSSQWRALTAPPAGSPATAILKRLEEFGLKVAAEPSTDRFERDVLSPGGDFEGAHNPEQVRAIVRRIQAEVPAARDAFVSIANPAPYFGKCMPASADYDRSRPELPAKLYDAFQKAFRFQSGSRSIWLIHYQCADGSAAFKYPTAAMFDSESAQPWIISEHTGDPNSSIGTVCFSNVVNCEVDAQIFGGRVLLLSSAQGRAIEVFDLNTRRNLFKKYNLPRGDLLERVLISPDGRLVLQINSDGSFVGYRFADSAQLFEGRYVDDEIVVWTPDGRFDATSEGAHYVSLRLPGRIENHTFEQFSARLRTPGLVAKAVAGEQTPRVQLVSPPALSGRIEIQGGRIRGTAQATGESPVEALLVYQDGLLTNRLGHPPDGRSWSFEVPLLPGTRWVSMIALDTLGLASVPKGRDVARAAKRRVHVLAVGVDHYDDPQITDLELARSDARRFAQAVASTGGEVDVASTRMLLDSEASPQAILSSLRDAIGRASPGETVMLFFAGHGVRSPDGRLFLATPQTRHDDIPNTALPWTEVAAVLATSKTRIAVLLDTCHSGEAGTGAYSTNDAAVQSLLERVPSGIVVFSASKGRELSEEAPAVGGGVFTAALVNVIAGDRARFDTNRNGAIEISELYRGIKSQVITATGGRQTPWIARNQMVGDFALF